MTEIRKDDLNLAIVEVMKSKAGQEFIFWILGECGMYQEPRGADEATTNYMIGRQSIGRKMLAKFDDINPKFYPLLLLSIAEDIELERAVDTSDEKAPNMIDEGNE